MGWSDRNLNLWGLSCLTELGQFYVYKIDVSKSAGSRVIRKNYFFGIVPAQTSECEGNQFCSQQFITLIEIVNSHASFMTPLSALIEKSNLNYYISKLKLLIKVKNRSIRTQQ
ncbi:MAG: hypothetical protein ACI90V_008325 [Bacillariaceae sp.]|jgi:hypothetical protein